MPSLKRPEFWTINPWLLPPPGEADPKYSFPEEDLLPILVDLYFLEINPFWPVLHRPTFERKVADNLHLRDHRFGNTVLMVCSLGARHSDDRRVLLDGAEDHDFRSAGWKWYRQVSVIPKYLIYKPDLYELQTVALSALYVQYSPRKPKDLSGRSFPPTEAQCIMAFDSALNAWLNDIPEHLRWDPARENILHFNQSALLYAAYYNVQILVHRPFIPAPFEASPPGALPSLVICSNAARSCVRIFDAYERRGIQAKYNILASPVALAAAIVLLLSAWSGKKSDFAYNPSKELDQVHSCLKIMKEAENKYVGAGRYTDMLNRLLYARVGSLFCDVLPPSIRQRLDGSPKPIRHRLPPEHQYRENGADWSHRTGLDGAFTHLTQMYDPTNIDMPPFPVDMAVNTDIMAMWPTAPSGFHVDDWSYFMSEDMSGQQFNQFSSELGQANLYGETDQLQTYLCVFRVSMELPPIKRSIVTQKRVEFWTPPSWVLPPPGDNIPQYSFPPPDLLPTLVERYFEEVNPFWPVLHRPTFDRKVTDKLHLRDHKFGSTLLMVCSLGARYSDDPRVVLEGIEDRARHSAGWKWHSQVRVIPKHLIYKPDLYELQTVALSALYLQAFASTALCWNQVGFGLRRAQDVGAHRYRPQAYPTAETEQWKRVFWVLLCLEWLSGTFIGRPLAIHDQDFDQELPIDCDDEYWDLPEPNQFKQPKDKPSNLSYFICYAKLLEIEAAVATTLYSARKPKDLGGHPLPPTEAQCIVAFDSALNSWLDSVPEHLRWDPTRRNIRHLTQSALLYTGISAFMKAAESRYDILQQRITTSKCCYTDHSYPPLSKTLPQVLCLPLRSVPMRRVLAFASSMPMNDAEFRSIIIS
ncbi:Zn(2)-C6 fungal-type domain-containing protein [Mycena venus]|uniref:Zn(2)-C6 fungal-type domain-containing protein n=1 Tax=Mycena venus TaxID=2733690 RepID=A0A8H6YI67_9AGAR|nr:Zn(2)-C6 fungal-type domain-containing protein [Mycena venus]